MPYPVKQGVPKVLTARQHREAGGFGYGDKVFVFVEQRKRNWRVRFRPWLPVIGEPLSRGEQGFGRGRPVVQPYFTGQDPFPPGFRGRVRIAPEIELKNGFPCCIRLNRVSVSPTLVHFRAFAHV